MKELFRELQGIYRVVVYWVTELFGIMMVAAGAFEFGAGRAMPTVPYLVPIGELYPDSTNFGIRIAGFALAILAIAWARWVHEFTRFERYAYTAVFMLCALAGYLVSLL